jgi:pimeloyl-ACP methyl ester carboxylesterase
VSELVTIPDPGAPGGVGRIRLDRRPPASAPIGPPLVILGGMTQTLASWSAHLRSFAQGREVIAYEARGQGHSELDLRDASPARHIADFCALLDALAIPGPVDLCGFSFGGRLALAIAAAHPGRVRRLVVSGVSAGRGALGRVIVRGWRAALQTGDLNALAWISLADTLGADYLSRHEAMLPAFVEATVQRNSYAGIRALFEQTMDDVAAAAFAPLALAAQIRAPTLLLCGEHDRLAPAADLEALALAFTPHAEREIVAGAGHTVAIEAPTPWRARVLAFLDGSA